MAVDTPPSLAFMISAGWSLHADCPGCRALVLLDAVAIALAKGEAATIDRLKFRCRRCGSRATAYASGTGNLLMGRDQWPPRTEKPPPPE